MSNARPHHLFIILGNAVPVILSVLGGLSPGDVLALLYVEFAAGLLVNNHRIRVHRKTSRLRGHFESFEMADGTLRARSLSFPARTGLSLFFIVLYGGFVWVVYTVSEAVPDPALAGYALISAVIPVGEYLWQRPGIGTRSFEWIEEYGHGSIARILAFGAMIPTGGFGLIFGTYVGAVVLGLSKAIFEFIFGAFFGALRKREGQLPGFAGALEVQRAWREAVAHYAKLREHGDQVLEPATWRRLMREATGDYSHVSGGQRRMGEKARFASQESDLRPARRLPQAEQKTRELKLKASDTVIELSADGSVLGKLQTDPRNLKPRPGILDGQPIRAEIATPWNGRVWQLRAGDQRLVEGRERRVMMLIATRRLFDVSLSFGEYLWSPGDGTTAGWTLTDPQGQTIYGRLVTGGTDGYDGTLELPAAATAADALFLAWLRLDGALERIRHRKRR